MPPVIRLHRSGAAVMAIVAIHGLAMTAVVICDVALAIKMALMALMVFSMGRSLQIHALRIGRSAIVALSLHESGELEIQYRCGHRVAAWIDRSSTVSPWLMALRLRHKGERRSSWLALLPDAMEAGNYRRLRIWLGRQRAS